MSEKTVQPFADIAAVDSLSRDEQAPGFAAVQDFLRRFGYLTDREGVEANRLDDTTATALVRYQEFYGLTPTGVFDDQTREAMTTHRCGLPDLFDGLAFTALCAWPNTSLTFAFEDGTNDVGGSTEFQAVRNAFATWAAVAPFTFTDTAASQQPDVTIDWRPANDPDFSMVGGTLAHADFPPECGVVTNTLPKPVHFDDSEHLWVVGSVAGGFDVETVALHEIGHILGLAHSDVAGSVMFPTVASNSTKRALTADDISGVRDLYSPGLPTAGTYTIRQKSNGRFLDAHEIADRDFRLVTRTAQNNDTQRWDLTPVGAVYVIRQKNTGRFLDAHESSENDFRLVTRTAQGNASQLWVAMPVGDGSTTFRQLSNGRFVDAHEISERDFGLVTRTAQDNDTQRWLLTNVGPSTFTMRQKSNGRFVDAHESSANDFAVVTRTAQNNDSQRWVLAQVGAVYTVQQRSNGRFVDAHEVANQDFAVVTRTAQNNDTQRWVLLPGGGGSFTVQQLSSRRFVDAHEAQAQDFSVVTRTEQNNDAQRWLFDQV